MRRDTTAEAYAARAATGQPQATRRTAAQPLSPAWQIDCSEDDTDASNVAAPAQSRPHREVGCLPPAPVSQSVSDLDNHVLSAIFNASTISPRRPHI